MRVTAPGLTLFGGKSVQSSGCRSPNETYSLISSRTERWASILAKKSSGFRLRKQYAVAYGDKILTSLSGTFSHFADTALVRP